MSQEKPSLNSLKSGTGMFWLHGLGYQHMTLKPRTTCRWLVSPDSHAAYRNPQTSGATIRALVPWSQSRLDWPAASPLVEEIPRCLSQLSSFSIRGCRYSWCSISSSFPEVSAYPRRSQESTGAHFSVWAHTEGHTRKESSGGICRQEKKSIALTHDALCLLEHVTYDRAPRKYKPA